MSSPLNLDSPWMTNFNLDIAVLLVAIPGIDDGTREGSSDGRLLGYAKGFSVGGNGIESDGFVEITSATGVAVCDIQ